MKRLGRRNRPFWRIVATDKRAARDGRVIEELGWYDPHKPSDRMFNVDRERVSHWLKEGATPSETCEQLLLHVGIDAKGNEVEPKPWKKKGGMKRAGPKAASAESVAADAEEKAEAEGAAEAKEAAKPEEAKEAGEAEGEEAQAEEAEAESQEAAAEEEAEEKAEAPAEEAEETEEKADEGEAEKSE